MSKVIIIERFFSKIIRLVDQVFYTKLILGIQSIGNCGLLCFYLKKSFNDKIALGQDVYDNSVKMLEFYEGPEKTEIVQRIQSLRERENNVESSSTIGRNSRRPNLNSNFKKYYDDKENQNQENKNWKNQSKKTYHNNNENQSTTAAKNSYFTSKPARQNFNWKNQENKETQGGVFSNALKNRFR